MRAFSPSYTPERPSIPAIADAIVFTTSFDRPIVAATMLDFTAGSFRSKAAESSAIGWRQNDAW
jgi:hypothetical protein